MKAAFKKKYILYIVLVVFILLIKGAVYSDISVEALKAEYANEYSKFIEVNEMQVHYRDEGKGFPIILIHGTASSLHTWNDWTKELTQTYRVIRMDLPAFGITGPNKNADYSIKAYTQFLHQFLAKMEVDKFYLVGNSLGGNIAWNYAAEYPEKIEKLILFFSVSSLLFLVSCKNTDTATTLEKNSHEIKEVYEIDRIEPPNWWVGFKNMELQLLVKSPDISKAVPRISYAGVLLKSVSKADSPNYLFLNLSISKETKPGKFNIVFTFDHASSCSFPQLNSKFFFNNAVNGFSMPW